MSFFPEADPTGIEAGRLKALFGFVPRVFRLQGPVSDVVDQQAVLVDALLANENCLPRRQKEEMLLAAASARGDAYGIALHQQMLRLLGATGAEIAAACDGSLHPLAAFARTMALTPSKVTQIDIERLRSQGLGEGQLVEAILTCGLGVLLSTLQFGTGADPDFAVAPAASTKIPHPTPPESRPNEGVTLAPAAAELDLAALEDDPDSEFVRRVQAGDVEAFAILVDRHSQRVYRALAVLLGNEDEARDALQDTFLKAFRALPAFEGRSKFSSWLVSIAQNTGLQRLRERKPHESLDEPLPEEEFRPRQVRAWTDDPEQMYSKAEIRSKVERAISGLPTKYRVVLIMRDLEQVSTKDAAESLGLSVSALKARLIRGRLMLREALAPHFSARAKAL